MTKKNILILYHKNCFDGFGGAWAAWKKFGNKAEYIAVGPETLPVPFPKNKKIYAIDVSYPVAVQKRLRKENDSLVVLDHHISLSSDTMYFPENVFQNDHSGAVIAWNYFHPKKAAPKFLLHIEDIDLWMWKLSNTREIISMLGLVDYDFSAWSNFYKNIEDAKKRKKIIANGKLVALYERSVIKKLLKNAALVSFCGIKTLCVNSPVLNSEIGNALIEKMPPMGIVWTQRGNEIGVSLRSNGSVDVSKMAQKYGGGGHKRSAGFGFSAERKFPWKTMKQ